MSKLHIYLKEDLLTKKAVLFVAVLFMSTTIRAYDIEVKNSEGVTIYYNYINNGTELEVASYPTYLLKYSGSVVIPEEVTDGDETLKVTRIGERAFDCCFGLKSVSVPVGHADRIKGLLLESGHEIDGIEFVEREADAQ